jgi:hypothetical protein
MTPEYKKEQRAGISSGTLHRFLLKVFRFRKIWQRCSLCTPLFPLEQAVYQVPESEQSREIFLF